MPVSSNSRVAKFIREKIRKIPWVLYIHYFTGIKEKQHKTPAQSHEQNYLQIIRTTCFSSWVHSIFYIQNRSTAHN